MEFGTVTYFDGRDNKRFGFLKSDVDGKQVFFHANNKSFAQVSDYGRDPTWIDDLKGHATPPIYPRKGNRIVFEREDTPRGPKATKWSPDPYPNHYYGQLATMVEMAVVWDILVVTFKKVQFPADSLFGTMEDRVRALLNLDGFGGMYKEEQWAVKWDDSFLCETWTDEQRTFRFELGSRFDNHQFVELSVGRGIVADITYDALDHARHARRWRLPATASLEDIIEAYHNYIDDMIT